MRDLALGLDLLQVAASWAAPSGLLQGSSRGLGEGGPGIGCSWQQQGAGQELAALQEATGQAVGRTFKAALVR